MADEMQMPRSEAILLAGGVLPDRVLSAEHTLLFVLDGAGDFVYFDRDLAALFPPGHPPEVGLPFRPESLQTGNAVARLVAEAQLGRAVEPRAIVPSGATGSADVWQFEAFPIVSPQLQTGHGVVCLLSREDPGHAHPADASLHDAALTERLERERLETTQAVAVTMRHEINNALTSLIGNAELILRRANELDPLVVARVNEIARQGRRIQTVLDRLEALSEIRTTTYYGGVQMIDLGEEPPASDD